MDTQNTDRDTPVAGRASPADALDRAAEELLTRYRADFEELAK